jgi:hypothetical protein
VVERASNGYQVMQLRQSFGDQHMAKKSMPLESLIRLLSQKH